MLRRSVWPAHSIHLMRQKTSSWTNIYKKWKEKWEEADNLAFTAPRWIKPAFKETLQHSQLMSCILDFTTNRTSNTLLARYSVRVKPRLFNKKLSSEYRYTSLNDGDTFWEWVVRRFRRCANVYLHKPREYSITYYKPRLYGIAYCS
jgi:hypothetical protein